LTDQPRRWWGFRLRNPLDYEPPVINRRECVQLFLLLATVFQIGWLGRLTLLEEPTFQDQVVIPVAGFAAFFAAGLVFRLKWLESFQTLHSILVFSREQGDLRRHADTKILILAVFVLGLGMGAQIGYLEDVEFSWSPLLVPKLMLFASVISVSAGFTLLQSRVDFSKRKWEPKIPDWLGKGGANLVDFERDEILAPSSGASPIYHFSTSGGTPNEIGVPIPSTVIGKMRELNRQFQGYLYQKHPQATTLADRDPARDLGRAELIVLSSQLLSVLKKNRCTKLQMANLVLHFVQKNFKYEHDNISTADFPGGPFDEYGRFAMETIHDGVGDCDCTSILYASLLALLGFDVALLYVTIKDTDTNEESYHCAVGVNARGIFRLSESTTLDGLEYVEDPVAKERTSYLYAETATKDTSRSLGVIPPNWKDVHVVTDIIPISSSA
jgi:hypothetical protein